MSSYSDHLCLAGVICFFVLVMAFLGLIPSWVLIIGAISYVGYVHFRSRLYSGHAKNDTSIVYKYSDLKMCKRIVSGNILRDNSSLTFLESRAIPNKRLVDSFGIDNSFTSMNEEYCRKFREKAANLLRVNNQPWTMLMGHVETVVTSEVKLASNDVGASLELVSLVQNTVFQSVLIWIFPQTRTKIDPKTVAMVTNSINLLWMASKRGSLSPYREDKTTLTKALEEMFPEAERTPRGNPLNMILPSYETMWRAVLCCFIEVMYRSGNERRLWRNIFKSLAAQPSRSNFKTFHGGISAEQIVQETLRLYPPTKSIYRFLNPDVKISLPNTVAADIMALHRDPEIWGRDPLLFDPRRWAKGNEKEKRYRQDAFMAFGCLPNICPAKEVAPMMIGILVAALVNQTRNRFEAFVLKKSDEISGTAPLRLERDAYASLRLRRIA